MVIGDNLPNPSKILLKRPRLGVIIIFLSLPLLAFPEIIFGNQTLYWTDLTWIHYPRHIFAAEEWLAGRVPLWDPYEDTGLPLLAEAQVGVLYPLSLIFLSPLSPTLELSLFILFHFTLAAIFTYFLARALPLSRSAATIAGLAFGLGGFLMAQVSNLNIMTGAVWLPLILYGVMQTFRYRVWLIALLAGVPLALQILIAQPQVVFYTMVLLIGYWLYRLSADLSGQHHATSKICYSLHSLFLLGLIILTGLLLAAPQLLPTLELQQLSVRSQERDFAFLTKTSLPPAMLLNLLLPGAFGNNVVGFAGGDPFQEVFIYGGFIPLLLTLFSWRQRHKRDVLFFYLLLIGTLLLALGRYTPLYQYIIQYLPGFALFRIPARWLMGVNLAVAILAGFGVETVREYGLSRVAFIVLWLGISVLAIGIIILWSFKVEGGGGKLTQALLTKGFSLDPIYHDNQPGGSLLGLRIPARLWLVNLIVTGVLFTLWARRWIGYPLFAGSLIAAVSLDLVVAGGTTINPIKPAQWWQELSGGGRYVLEQVGEARVFPLGMGSEVATVSHLGQYFPSVYHIRSAGGHGSSLRIAHYGTFLNEADPVLALQLVGVRYLLTLGQMGADVASTYPLAYSDDDSFVYENTAPLPRTLVVHETILVSTSDEALTYLQTRGIDPAQTVILETSSDQPPPALPQPALNSTATIIAENPQLITIKTSLAAAGYVVLLDTYYPGWVAQVDEAPMLIYRANYIGRAVFVPAGEHIVQFSYHPLSFRIGVGLSLFMLAVLAGTLLVGVWRPRYFGAIVCHSERSVAK